MSNSSLKWSALIYGRTYEVDFRLIAMPEYFVDAKDRTWAENHILATTQIPERLSGNPRWSLFTNDKYCVFATTCMVKELFPNDISQETKDITTDFRGRPLYAFIGYVAKRDRDESGQFPLLPVYDDLKPEQFQPLYQKYVVEQCWDVKPYQPESKQPIATIEEDVRFNFTQSTSTEFKLNQDRKKIRVWSHEYRLDVWNTVIQEIEIYPQPISLCLGLSTPRDAEKSPFLNATVLRLDTSKDGRDLDKSVEKEPPQKNQITNSPSSQSQKTEDTSFFKHEQYEKNNNIDKNYDFDIYYNKIKNLVFAIVMYAFDKQKSFGSEHFSDVPKAKIKKFEESLNNSHKTKIFTGFYDFVKNEYKQLTYNTTSFEQDLSELAKITAINHETLQKELEKSMHSNTEITNVINDISILISNFDDKSRRETQQQQNSQGLVGFELKKADSKHEQHSTSDIHKSTEKKHEENPEKKDWF